MTHPFFVNNVKYFHLTLSKGRNREETLLGRKSHFSKGLFAYYKDHVHVTQGFF